MLVASSGNIFCRLSFCFIHGSFAVKMLLSLIRSYLFILVFISITPGDRPKKILLLFMSESVLPIFSSNIVFMAKLPGSGRSAGEGIGYPLQCSWASLVAQLVKNRPAVQETCPQSLGWEDPLEKGKAAHSSILAWRIPWTVVHGLQRDGHN